MLTENGGDRWPLVLWKGPDARKLSAEDISMLIARGIAPTIRLDPDFIDAAKRISATGAPVIALEARSGHWPYARNDNRNGTVDPTDLSGWRRAADRLAGVLGELKSAGVELNAAWLDYENAPVNLLREQVDMSRIALPSRVMDDAESFRVYRRQLWLSLLSTYIAAPIRESFPAASVTNWVVSASRADSPLLDWHNRPHPRTDIGLFTATNPLAYGVDVAFHAIRGSEPIVSQRQVDRIYTHILLRQVSADAYARRLDAPHLESIAWVARWVNDLGDRRTPAMSRESYREALRHIWLRGINGMMVFNSVRSGLSQMAVLEVLDAAAIYRETMPLWGIVSGGEVMNTEIPEPKRNSVIWSGIRDDDEAIMRVSNPLAVDLSIEIEAWPEETLRIPAPTGNHYFWISRDELSVTILEGNFETDGFAY